MIPFSEKGTWTASPLTAAEAGKVLSMQVVRAVVDQEFWKRLNAKGRFAGDNVPQEQLAAHLKAAIRLKASDRKIPMVQRAELVLALDATRLPGLALDAVVTEFRLRHSQWASSLRFQGGSGW